MANDRLQKLVSSLEEMDRPVVKEYNTIVRDEHVIVKRYPSVTDNPEFFRARDTEKQRVKLFRWTSLRK